MAESRARHLSRFDWKFNSAVKAAGVTPVLSCKSARQVSGIVPQFIVRGDFADQSPRRRLARANTAAGDQHFQRRTAPNQPRQSLRSAPTGDDPPSDARMREHRVSRSDSRMTRQRQVETSADAVSANRGDHRLRTRCDPSQHLLPAPRKSQRHARCESCHLGNLGARRKCQFAASDDSTCKFRRFRQSHDFTVERVQHGHFQTRQSIIAFQAQQENIVLWIDYKASAHRNVTLRAEQQKRGGG